MQKRDKKTKKQWNIGINIFKKYFHYNNIIRYEAIKELLETERNYYNFLNKVV